MLEFPLKRLFHIAQDSGKFRSGRLTWKLAEIGPVRAGKPAKVREPASKGDRGDRQLVTTRQQETPRLVHPTRLDVRSRRQSCRTPEHSFQRTDTDTQVLADIGYRNRSSQIAVDVLACAHINMVAPGITNRLPRWSVPRAARDDPGTELHNLLR